MSADRRKREERKKRSRRVLPSRSCLFCHRKFKPDPMQPRKTCSAKCAESRRVLMQSTAYRRRKERAA